MRQLRITAKGGTECCTIRRKQTTLVIFLLDRTGSMDTIKAETIGGFNAYLDTLSNGKPAIFVELLPCCSSTQCRSTSEPSAQGCRT